MASRATYSPAEKSVAQVLSEIKDELKEFAAVRVAILRTEMREKLALASAALPAIAAGAVLAVFAVFFLSVALVAVVAWTLGGGAGAWAAGFAIVGSFFLLTAALAILFGVGRLRAGSLKPERTLHVLRQDQIWLQNETRNGL